MGFNILLRIYCVICVCDTRGTVGVMRMYASLRIVLWFFLNFELMKFCQYLGETFSETFVKF